MDDLAAVLDATNHVMRQAGLPPLSRERFREEFTLPFSGVFERWTPGVPPTQLEEWFHARFRQVQHGIVELPHAREFLEFCRRNGLRTLLLSAVDEAHFRMQTRANRFDQFLDHCYVGVRDKREKIRDILREHDLAPGETMFVGDMEHDVETARHGGIRSVAVLTGYGTSERLRAAGPDLVVEHLGELERILSRNGMRLRRHETGGRRGTRLPVVTVGAAVLDETGRVLVLRTRKWSGLWGIPGGKVKYGETSVQALRRELLEETGLAVDDIRFVLVQDCIGSAEFYRDEHFVLLNYSCRTREPERVVLNDEAEEFRWVPLEEALRMNLNTPTRILFEALHPSARRSPEDAASIGARP